MIQPVSKYSIAVKGLSLGKHDFAFDIDNAFFALFEGSEVGQGNLTVAVSIDKKPAFMAFQATIKGAVTVECDRCLDDLELPVDVYSEAVIKFADKEEENNDDEGVIYIDPVKNEIDLAQYLFDTIILSLPLQRVHPKGKCNKEMMDKLVNLQIN